MRHDLLREVEFWRFLVAVDQDIAKKAREKRCSFCGGRLDCANYRRNPRGGPEDLPEECRYRLSFCCAAEGCRKRMTPPSVRFLGRKVYFSAVIILISAMRQGPSPRRVRELSQLFGADRRTIARWQVFWREHFPETAFWKVARGRFVPAAELVSLPLSLVEAFCRPNNRWEGWEELLRFLSPISIAGALSVKNA